jgi:glycosyltransferase involved in cell wall biosynthesis
LNPTISAIVPLLNEAPALEELHHRLSSTLAAFAGRYEIVFVDDGSSDGSARILRSIAARDQRVIVVTLGRRFGKAGALAAGFRHASGEIFVTIDADLQDRPEEIPRLVARLVEGADLVAGRKRLRRDGWIRRIASKLFNACVTLATGADVHDINSGLKVMRREVADEIPLYGQLHRFIPSLAAARGFAIAEVDVAHDPRRYGSSRYGWTRYTEAALDLMTVLLLTRYGKRPLHLFGTFGGALATVGCAILAYLGAGWLQGNWISGRPLLSLGILLVILGIQTLFFGLLAELIVVSGATKDPGYSVRRVIRGDAHGDVADDSRSREEAPSAAGPAAHA